jgi:hypothetical protein
MAARKAGKEYTGEPETPTEDAELDVIASPPLISSLDDLRILDDFVTQDTEQVSDDTFTFTPTVCKLLNGEESKVPITSVLEAADTERACEDLYHKLRRTLWTACPVLTFLSY